MLRRIGAFLIDFILTILVALLVSVPAKAITSYNPTVSKMDSTFESIAAKHGISLNITTEEFNAFTEEQNRAWEDTFTEISENEEATALYDRYVRLSIIITYVSLVIAVLLSEVVVPLFFRNAQTVGKRLLKLVVVNRDSDPISLATLLVRSIFGKLLIEYGLPVFFYFGIVFGGGHSFGFIGFMMLVVAQIMCVLLTKDRRAIHDFLASTRVAKA